MNNSPVSVTEKDTKPLYGRLALLSAALWGAGFAFQKDAMDSLPPLAFTSIRLFLAVAVILLMTFMFDRSALKGQWKQVMRAAIVPSILFATLTAVQQIGLVSGLASKAGFILSLYVCIVPIIAVFIGYKIKLKELGAAAVAFIGVLFLTIKEGFAIDLGDTFFLMMALVFSVYILAIDYYVKNVSPLMLAGMHVFYAAVAIGIISLFTETFVFAGVVEAQVSILYSGAISAGLSLSLQIISQKYVSPGKLGILMCTTALFAALLGWLMLGERLTLWEIIGAIFIMSAILLTRIRGRAKKDSVPS